MRKFISNHNYWLYGIIFLSLCGLVLSNSATADPIVINNPQPNSSGFGSDVKISGNKIVISTNDPSLSGNGHVYLFEANTGDRIDFTEFNSNARADGDFGASIDIYDSVVVAGDPIGTYTAYAPGGVTMYDLSSDSFRTIIPSEEFQTNYGHAVSISNDKLLIAKPEGRSLYAHTNSPDFDGEVEIWSISNLDALTIENPEPSTFTGLFGYSVSGYGNFALIGSPTTFDKGRAYLYNSNDGSLLTTITDSDEGGIFGISVALHEDKIIIGDPSRSTQPGKVHVFNVEGMLLTTLSTSDSPFGTTSYNFGKSVSVSDDFIVVGAPHIARVYVYSAETFELVTVLEPSTSWIGRFGESVDVDGDLIVVGSPFYRGTGETQETTGRVYVFEISGNSNGQSNMNKSQSSESKLKQFLHKKIAFTTNTNSNNEIYVMNPDGTQKNLSRNPANEYHPAWSPDGSKIAFTSDRDGDREIYVMNPDGTNQKQLTNNTTFDQHPTWSPNGKQIAYRSDFDGAEIYVMDARDGLPKTNLSKTPSSGEGDPAWSPDGSKIAFFSNKDSNNEIYVMDARDGSDKTRLTWNSVNDRFPAWSPDGSEIVFMSERDGNGNIYVVKANGGDEPSPLTTNKAFDSHPAWSPDGSKIAFTSNRDGVKEVYIMDHDGENIKKMSKDSSQGRFPDWYPLKTSLTDLSTLNHLSTIDQDVLDNTNLGTIMNTLPNDDLLREKVIKTLNEQAQGVSPCLIVASMEQSDIVAGDTVSFDLVLVGEFANNRNVAVSVVDPTGSIILSRTITVDQNGLADFDFKLPTAAVTGDYKVALTHGSSQNIHKESLQFTVDTLQNSMQSSNNVNISSIIPIDQQGNPVDSFRKGGLGYAKVTVAGDVNSAPLTTVNLFDSQSTSLGVGSFKGTVSGDSEMIISFYIPDDAATGKAEIFANMFSDWPTNGGTPLTEEVSGEVMID